MKSAIQIFGSIGKIIQDHEKKLARFNTETLMAVAENLQEDLRRQTKSAGLGNKIAKSWRIGKYPKGKISLGPAALVYSKAPKIIASRTDRGLITPKNADWLAIPSKQAPKKGLGGKRLTPETWPEWQYGKLRYVPVDATTALLVVRSKTGKSGRVMRLKADGKKRKAEQDIVMFILKKQVKRGKSINLQNAERRALQKLKYKLQNG